MRSLVGNSVAVLTLLLTSACQQAPPQSALSQNTAEMTALVKLVDLEERQVLVEGENGSLHTIIAGPEVRNLAQVSPGDTVKVIYQRSVAVSMASGNQASSGTQMATAAIRAPEGAMPEAVVGEAVRMVVRVISFDADSNLVVFSAPDGFVHSVVVLEPEIQEFARGLEPGDEVEVIFTEALAAAVVAAAQ